MNNSDTPQAIPSETEVGKVLILDNYDSFTYNIRGELAKLGIDSVVKRNDEISMEYVEAMDPSHIIISPGPGTPDNPEDIGITNEVIEYAIRKERALLGVCLGHQAITKYFGGNIEQAEEIMHGKTSNLDVAEDGGVLFTGVDTNAEVMRYHSLAAEAESFPSDVLHITSYTRDEAKTIMSFEHKELPIAGVQFHPESFATPEGRNILKNFLKMNPDALEMHKESGVHIPEDHDVQVDLPQELRDLVDGTSQCAFEQVPFECDLAPEQVYERLHGASEYNYCFESLDANGGERVGRFSYFGVEPEFVLSACNNEFYLDDEQIATGDISAFDALNATVEQMSALSITEDDVPEGQKLTGGFVGAMSYEAIQYREPTVGVSTPPGEKTFSYGYFSDGLIYDNHEGQYYYYTRGENRMQMYRDLLQKEPERHETRLRKTDDGVSSEEFQDRVRRIRDEKIRTGETFQTVISRKETFELEEGSLADVYLELRKNCPSGNMHAMRMGDFESIGSFPELTLKVEGDVANSYQVAGTRPRTGDEEIDAAMFEELRANIKEIAEHIMLVDLGRNDLEMCSIPGTVELVEEMLMHRLDAVKVMHIASEIRSKINGMSPLRALLAVAPMGTVSGAPKVRSMQIIYELEEDHRGLYAGSFGFVDMRGNLEAIVGLRSVMRSLNKIIVQAGAGIVFDSDPKSEYVETVNKTKAAKGAIQPFLHAA